MKTRRLFVGVSLFVALLGLAVFSGSRAPKPSGGLEDAVTVDHDDWVLTEDSSPQTETIRATLASAVRSACDGRESQADDGEWAQLNAKEREDFFNALMQTVSERLSESTSAEHLHVAAILTDDRDRRFALMDRAIAIDPTDPLLVWRAVQMCSGREAPARCLSRDWERQLIAVDGENSESWIQIAANRYAEGDVDSALMALRRASTAAESRAYWPETVEMIERGLAASSDFTFPERANMAFGFAAAIPSSYYDHYVMCKDQSQKDSEWAYACLAYGELVEARGKEEMSVSHARSMQWVALDASGEKKRAEELRRRIEARSRARLESYSERMPVDRLIVSSPAVFSAYLAAVKAEGGASAMRAMSDEFERQLELRPELACE
ncbi:MAG: hypothetical protein AAF574_10045 [Pseudomonadota bacterium]